MFPKQSKNPRNGRDMIGSDKDPNYKINQSRERVLERAREVKRHNVAIRVSWGSTNQPMTTIIFGEDADGQWWHIEPSIAVAPPTPRHASSDAAA
jgi:hypothetical protein